MSLQTPILFIAFNRPRQTEIAFAEIRRARPSKLFVAVDGPRPYRSDDIDKCREVREIVSKVDWPCELKTLFREKNLGCRLGATTAVTWFFEHVEDGIIIEDDCVPDQSFFPFCTEMLEHFRHNEKIAMICGYNIFGTSPIKESYTFSRYGHLWGWASWRRVWKQYDLLMKVWADPDNKKLIKKAMNDPKQWNYREWLYDETYFGRKDTWDYQWESYRLLHGQICVIPKNNMIRNTGFGKDATHTTQVDSHLIIPGTTMQFPLVHNNRLVADDDYDRGLRPPTRAASRFERNLKNGLKTLGKKVTPPIIYDKVRELIKSRGPSRPRWNTLSYEPMKGIEMYFDPRGSWQNKIINNAYDSFMFDRLSSLGVSSKTIFDIGGHVGYHTLYFARLVGPKGKVVAFEPNKNNYERLKMNVERNADIKDRIKVFNSAVADKDGEEEFNASGDIEGGRSSGAFLGRADTFQSRASYAHKGFNTNKVKTVTLDSFMKAEGKGYAPDVIKIDVEGAESLVLEGARETLRTHKPFLLIEIHSMLNMYNVLQILSSLSYDTQIARVEANGVCYIEAQPKN